MSRDETKGILGTKLGMTQIFDEENHVVPVTVVEAGPCVVTQVHTKETDGYDTVQIAYGEIDPHEVNKPGAGHFKKAGVTPRRHSIEVRTPDASSYEIDQSVGVGIFGEIEYVDVIGTSKGHGFAGDMKRHGFAGQGATHGNQVVHHRVGGIGACATPGRVFKGERMTGRIGNDRATTQNLKIQKVDADANLLLIKGTVPGARSGLLVVKTATKGGAHT